MSIQAETRPFEDFPTEFSQGINPDEYNLTPERLNVLEQELVTWLKNENEANDTVVAVAVDSNTKLASFGRTYETLTFPGYDFSTAMKPYEDRSLFVYTVDLEMGKIAHIKRLVRARSDEETAVSGMTGIEIIDDRLKANAPEEAADLNTLLAYHGLKSAGKSLNVTTNMATHRVEPSREKPYSLISYKATFEIATGLETTSIFAYLNSYAIKSLSRLGVQYDQLLGKEFHLPIPEGYDEEYLAICIPASEDNTAAFTKVNPAKPFTKIIAARNVPVYAVGVSFDHASTSLVS